MQKIQNRMTQKDFFRLCQYLEANREKLEGQPWQFIAECCEAHLSLTGEVQRRHLQKAEEALEVDWILLTPEQRNAKEERDLRKAVSVVAHHLADVYRRTGASVPAELAEVCRTGFELKEQHGAQGG